MSEENAEIVRQPIRTSVKSRRRLEGAAQLAPSPCSVCS
jgi:hypothetical protein